MFNSKKEFYEKCNRLTEISRSIDECISASMTEIYRYDLDCAVENCLKQYSKEDVKLVTAITVSDYRWDGRLTSANKEWARSLLAGTEFDGNTKAVRKCSTHLAIFNGFVDTLKRVG